MLPCVIFEDEHLLVINKPAGVNTHAPSPYAGEGIYDWLRNHELRWASLAIIHRLDKETSGVMVFGKTPAANRSLTDQFTQRLVRKKYSLLTDQLIPATDLHVKSCLVRAGEKYVSRPVHPNGEIAETRFGVPASASHGRLKAELRTIKAEPLTGRTHQIRVHAADNGFPILGDTLYGGTPFQRVCLHAEELSFEHPTTGAELTFRVPVDFEAAGRLEVRSAFIEPVETNAFRLINGASDGWPGWYVDKLDAFLLSQSEQALTPKEQDELARLLKVLPLRGAYHKTLTRQVRRVANVDASPRHVMGEAAPERFVIRENGVSFELSLSKGYSVGLFLDQRDNRRRFQTRYIAPDFPLFKNQVQNVQPEVLNTFAYTCGFSVCAALAGGRVTSLDLSKKYLEWGMRNFVLNGLDPDRHDFIYGDAFDWLRRLGKKGRSFDAVILDPPTFSQSKERGVFRTDKDYGELVATALPLLKPGGVLFASTNTAEWPPEEFLAVVEKPVRTARRKIESRHYIPQPPDFPISRAEPAYLKTVWMRIG